jgi:hypothetical protein
VEVIVKHSPRPPILTSALNAELVDLTPGETPQVACPLCGRWRDVERKMLMPHFPNLYARQRDQKRCPGSAQRIVFDETSEQWQRRLAEQRASYLTTTACDPNRRQATPTSTTLPPVPPPVFRLAR